MKYKLKPQTLRLHDWRAKVAQTVLTLLYGREWHYVSPWRGAGIANGVVLTKDGKVLMGKRRGRIEHSGKWSLIGGYVNLEKDERIEDAVVRIAEKEGKLHLDPLRIIDKNIIHIELSYKLHKLEQENTCAFVVFYQYGMNDDEYAQARETLDMHEFSLFTEQEIDEMWHKGIVAYDGHYNAIKEAFKRGL